MVEMAAVECISLGYVMKNGRKRNAKHGDGVAIVPSASQVTTCWTDGRVVGVGSRLRGTKTIAGYQFVLVGIYIYTPCSGLQRASRLRVSVMLYPEAVLLFQARHHRLACLGARVHAAMTH